MILPLFVPISVTLPLSQHFLVMSNHVILNCSCMCIFISCLSVLSNFLDYLVNGFEDGLGGPSLMYLFFTGLILFSFINILAVFREKPTAHYFSFFIWLLLVMFWFAVVTLLYSDWHTVHELCINHRCPDSFWLNDWYWLSRTKLTNTTAQHTLAEQGVDLASNSTTKPTSTAQVNFWYSLGSVLVCFSFIIYLALLGSLVWNHCSALCAIQRGDRSSAIVPGGYLYVFELRRRSQQSGEAEDPPADPQTTQNQQPSPKPAAATPANN